jgi:predicted SnoaL-like aldol condensation-catalyzing enzyme
LHTNSKHQVVELLKRIETVDRKSLGYINPYKYVQHNLAIGDGLDGVHVFLQALPKGSTKVNTRRLFQRRRFCIYPHRVQCIGTEGRFRYFRFEDGKIVEHRDNLQETVAQPSPSGHTMIDGPTTASEIDKTEANKALMQTDIWMTYSEAGGIGLRATLTGITTSNTTHGLPIDCLAWPPGCRTWPSRAWR